MKFTRFLAIVFIAGSLFACDNTESSGGEKGPVEMQPPVEAIPDSGKIVNDSLVVPDTVPGIDKKAGSRDSVVKR